MTLSEFMLELENDLSSFSKDINRISVKTNVINQLRIFGTNVTELKEKVETVKNSKVILPEDFKSLKLALRLHGTGYNTQGDREKTEHIYRQRIEDGAYFDEVNSEYVTTCNPKIVTEKIVIEGSSINFYYNPTWLSLVKGIKKDGLDSQCLNLSPAIRNTYSDEINITNGILNTNFTSGQIYLQYNALPTEGNELIIPEYTTGDLREYIMLYCKVKIAETLIANNQNPQGLGQLYQMWKAELPSLKSAALKECRFANLGKGWQRKFKQKQQQDITFYGLPNLPHA